MDDTTKLREKREALEKKFYSSLGQTDFKKIIEAKERLDDFVSKELDMEFPYDETSLAQFGPDDDEIKNEIFRDSALEESTWEDYSPYVECRVLSGLPLEKLVNETDAGVKYATGSGLEDQENSIYVSHLLRIGHEYGFQEVVHSLNEAVGGLITYMDSIHYTGDQDDEVRRILDVDGQYETQEEKEEDPYTLRRDDDIDEMLDKALGFEEDAAYKVLSSLPQDCLIQGFNTEDLGNDGIELIADLETEGIIERAEDQYRLNFDHPYSQQFLN